MKNEDKTKGQRKGKKVAATREQSVEPKNAKPRRKQGQSLMLESGAGLSTLADLATDCVFLFDSELNCVEINKAALRLFPPGTREKEVVGKHLLDISLGLEETGGYNKCLEVLETGTPFIEETVIPGPKFAGVRLAASVFRVNNGLGIAMKFATDVEKLEYVEREISEAEERYRTLVEDINDVVYILDDKAVISYVSPAIESILGYSASEIIGRPVYEYIYQQDWQVVMERFRSGSFPTIPGPFEFRVLTKSGDVRWVRNSPRTLIKHNHLIGYQGVLNDITDSKRALEDVERSERQFRALTENAQDAILIVSPDITIRYVSPSMERITGRKPEERMGKNPLDVCHPDDIAKVVEEFTPLLENKIPVVSMELRIQHKNGNLVDIELVGTNLLDDPAVGGIVINLRDITERKRAEEAHRRSEEQFQILVETMNDGLAVQDADGVVTFVNDKLCQMLGYARDELVGRNIAENLDGVNRKRFREQMRKRHKGVIEPYEIEFTRKDGSKITTRVSPQVVTDADGNIVGSFGIATDITEHRQADEELRASEEKLRGIFNSIGDAVIVSDLEGKIIDENDAALRMQGYSRKEEVIGKNGFQFISRKDRPRVVQEAVQAIERGYGSGEVKFVNRDGREYDAEATGSVLRDGSGNPEGFIACIRDVTERKSLERELKKIEEFSASLLTNCPNPILVINPDTSIRYVNPALEKLTGFSNEEIINQKIPYPWWTKESVNETREELEKAMSWGAEGLEIMFQKKNGEPFWAQITSTPIRKDGELDHSLSNWVDITERKQAEGALRESEERFRSLVENAPNMIIISDRDGKILFINYTTSGYTVEDTVGTSLYDYISAEYHDEVKRCVKEVFESGEPSTYEITGAGPRGTTSWYSTRLGPIKHDGHVVAVTHIVSDITEQRRSEEALRENEERLSAFMESATDGFTLWDSELNLVEINKVGLDSFPPGTKKEDVTGRNLRDLVPGDGETSRIKQYREVLKTGEPFVAEDIIPHPIFGPIKVDIRAFKVGDGLGVIVRDVTERNRMEEDLRESREKLRTLFDTMGVGITVVDLAGTIVDVNETVLRIKGFSREDVIGRYGLDFVAEKDRSRAIDSMMDLLKGEKDQTSTSDYTLLKKDGTEIPCEGHASLLRDGSGKVVGLISVERDITERKQSEEKLRRSEQNLRNAQKMAHLGHWEWDMSTNKVELSEEAQKIFGFKRDVVDFKEQVKIIHHEDMKRIRRETEMARTGKTSEIEFRIRLPGGDIRWILAKSDTMIDADENDEGKGIFGFVMDITERKKAEEGLRRYSERLRAMAARLSATEEEERRHLARELHDQVGQYLTALSINLSRASAEITDWLADPVRPILVDSQSIVERMSDVIRDVMADLRPPLIEDYGLVAALRWYAERFNETTGIKVTVQGEEPDPRLSPPHESTLYRIVQEVLTNVAKHAQASRVSVSVAVKGEKVRLVMEDDGIGFDTTEVDTAGGRHGWGLVIMSERARSMGGSFDIESRPGHGTRVTVEVGL